MSVITRTLIDLIIFSGIVTMCLLPFVVIGVMRGRVSVREVFRYFGLHSDE